MALYTDLPTQADLSGLLATSREGCVSIYLPTSALTQEAEASTIELKNLAAGQALAASSGPRGRRPPGRPRA